MRPRTGVLVCAAALGLGSLTGLVVLPAGGLEALSRPSAPDTGTASAGPAPSTSTPSGAPSPSASSSPSATSSSPTAPSPTSPSASASPVPDGDPPTERDLLTVASFAEQSVRVTYSSARGSTDPRSAVSQCTQRDAYDGPRTLKGITGHDPELEGLFEEPSTTDTADQVVATGVDADDAARAIARLEAAQDPCRTAEVGQWVYGPLRSRNLSTTESASWIGYFPAEKNTTGSAPSGADPCGGLVFARNAARFTVVHVYMCLDDEQLGGLAVAAARRLGTG